MTEKERILIKEITERTSREEVRKILEQVRKHIICSNISCMEALNQCTHFDDDIISKLDERYPIFEDLAELLDSKKTRNTTISDLSRIICYLE